MRGAVLAVLFLTCAGPALAEDAAPACPVTLYRWEEDCRALAGQGRSGIDAFRLMPLGDDATLTFGATARLAFEQVTAPNFGFGHFPESDAFARLGYVHADLRTSAGPRFFFQLVTAEESGRKPVERPFDRDTLDLYQAFVDLPLVAGEVPILLRVGRQELDLQGNRLVAVRDIANVRRSFDLALLEARPAGFIIDAFGGRPVLPNPGIFNDGSDPHETFSGFAAEHPVYAALGSLLSAGAFVFRRTRARAIYSEGVGRDDRDTLGVRLHGNIDAFDIAIQGALQRGTFGQLAIDATGIAVDTGWRFVDLPGQPRLGVSGGRASGDTRRGDGKLGTFDVIYPNLSYFTDASPIYPGNSADVEPNITLYPLAGVTVQTGIDILWRVSNQDAVYVPPGVPLIAGAGQAPSHEVSLPYIRGSWSPDPHWLIELSYVAILPGALIEQAGGHRAHYFRSAVTTRF
jgi:hypothetical protein